MPKSKVRKKAKNAPLTDRRTPQQARADGPSHPAYVAVMLGLMVAGLAWLCTNYLAEDHIQLFEDLGNWNFVIGFSLMVSGLFMTMRWR